MDTERRRSNLAQTNHRKETKLMREIWKTSGKVIFGLFGLMLLAWAGMLTVEAISEALPGDPIAPFVGLAVADLGAFAWLMTFISGARGLGQRTTALLATVADVAMVILMTAGGLHVLGSQAVSTALIAATAANYIAWYIYKVNDPETLEAIQEQTLEDEQFAEGLKRKKELFHTAMKQTKAQLDRDGHKLAGIISRRNYLTIKRELNLGMSKAEQKEYEDAIEAEVEDIPIPALPSPIEEASRGELFGELVRSFFGKRTGAYTSRNSISSASPQSLSEEPSEAQSDQASEQ